MLVINTKNVSFMIHDPSCSCYFIYGLFDFLERNIHSWQAIEWFEIMNTEHAGEYSNINYFDSPSSYAWHFTLIVNSLQIK